MRDVGGPLPEPPVPADLDVRDFDGFMLNIERLLSSELVALHSPEECWAALMLWCRARKQVPAGSLPDDERILASFSGAGKRWPKVRNGALHGFVKCSDGRLYHPVVCEEAMRAAARKAQFQQRRETERKRISEWRAKRRGNDDVTRYRGDDVTPGVTRNVALVQYEREREDSELAIARSGAGAPAAEPDPAKELWDRGLAIVGRNNRSLFGKMRKEYGDVAVLRAIVATEHERPSEPLEYFVGCLSHQKRETKLGPVGKLYAGFAEAARGNLGDGGAAAGALLDGRRAGGDAPGAGRGLDRGFG